MSTEERLARLERSQRWLRYANVVLVGTVLALAVPCCTARNDKAVSSPPVFTVTSDGAVFIPGVLRARGVEVLNLKGQLAVRLTEAGISTRNAEGKELVSIGATEDSGGGAIWTCSAKGKVEARIGSTEGGGGSIDVYNPFGKEVASLQCDKANCGLLWVCDQNGVEKDALSGSSRRPRPGDQWKGPRPRARCRQKAAKRCDDFSEKAVTVGTSR